MRTREEQQNLRALGFPIGVDGVRGPRTRQARRDARRAMPYRCRRSKRLYTRRLKWSAKHWGKVSKHFYYDDWKSNGNGWIKCERSIVVLAERVRKRVGAFGILSGYRDPLYNRRIGGASSSMHMFGRAFDPSRRLPLSAAYAAGAGGIGICAGSSTTFCHADTSYRRTWHY